MSSNKPTSRRSSIHLTAEDYEYLRQLSLRREDNERHARRAKFILAHAHGMNVTDAAKLAGFSRPVAYRWLERVQTLGVRAGLSDKPYELQDRTPESRAWVVSVASNPPSAVGFSGEPWTLETLARYIRAFAVRSGHPELARITPGGVHRILDSAEVVIGGDDKPTGAA